MYYCGIDLHARKMYVSIIDQKGKVWVHKNIKTDPELFFELIFPFITDLVVGVECMLAWYWVADLCADHEIPFALGHALYMKAIHGGKTKNDKIDSYKIACLLKGGNFPLAYAYPAKKRATLDLLRRRMYISRRCSKLVAHIQNTNTQYNLPEFGKKLSRKYNHKGLLRFVAVFCFFDGMNLTFSGAIKGAGDTWFIMWTVAVLLVCVMVVPVYVALEILNVGLFWAWVLVILYICGLWLSFMLRYRHGKWKKMRVIETGLDCQRSFRIEPFSVARFEPLPFTL